MTPPVRASVVVAIGLLFASTSPEIGLAQPTRLEHRVIFANARELGRRLDDAGNEGFSCSMVARPEPDAPVPGVVVVMSRPVGAASATVSHRVRRCGHQRSIGSGDCRDTHDLDAAVEVRR